MKTELPRALGVFAGQIQVPEDFNDPLPNDVLAAFLEKEKPTMKTTPFTSAGIEALGIEIDGRGADFYADGTYCAWHDSAMFNRCDATNNLTPYVSRNAVKAAFAAAERELSAKFEVGCIGVYVDEEGNIDPLNELIL